ncbi:MAG: hypothetical protein KKH72_06945 [Alphaproteobacteria bacterium]|nr:hypothetical protein [Alphaproteobacteria bacterium]
MPEDKLTEQLKTAIASKVQSGTKPKEILKNLRKQHPKAKSKDLALAAFALMIEVADQDEELAAALHDFGLAERVGPEVVEHD